MSERDLPGHGPGVPTDPELPTVQEQLIVFARELGELYRLERSRNAELEMVLESLQDTYLATMKSLATVIEAKDQTTRGHLDRTQVFGLALARRVDPELAADRRPSGTGSSSTTSARSGSPNTSCARRVRSRSTSGR